MRVSEMHLRWIHAGWEENLSRFITNHLLFKSNDLFDVVTEKVMVSGNSFLGMVLYVYMRICTLCKINLNCN